MRTKGELDYIEFENWLWKNGIRLPNEEDPNNPYPKEDGWDDFNAVVQLGEPSSTWRRSKVRIPKAPQMSVSEWLGRIQTRSCEFESHPRLSENELLSGWSRRHKLTHGKEKEEWDGNFRQPPKPDSYWTKKKGECRWCGKKITKTPTERRGKEINMRKSWHEDCATKYMIIYHSGEARCHVWLRDRGNSCGKQCTQEGLGLRPYPTLLEQKGVKKVNWIGVTMV